MKLLEGLFLKNLDIILKGIEKKNLSSNLRSMDSFRVMSYQLDFIPFATPSEAIYFINARIKEISRYSPKLVVFPRYTANLFLGLLPFSKKKLQTEKGLELSAKFYKMLRGFYIELIEVIGKMTGITLIAGSVFSPSEEIVVLFSEGKVNCFTKKDNIRVVQDGYNSIAFLFPNETQDYKKARSLQESGVNIFITSENWKEKNEWLMKTGIWARSQTLGIFGINSAMVGNIFGEEFYGASFVSAPAILTKNYSGFVVKLNDYAEKGVAIADIKMNVIEEYLSSLPKTYKKYWSFTWGGNS